MRVRASLAAASLVFGLACEGDLTELMVVVDSDMPTTRLHTVVIEVHGPTGEDKSARARLTGDRADELPRVLGVVHRGGPFGPVDVAVNGYGGEDVTRPFVQRRARLDFQPGRTLVLRMDLFAACVGRGCDVDETCVDANGTCAPEEIDSSTLPDWSGAVDGLDGSVPRDGGPDGGPDGCVPAEETCNVADDDCDGTTDEGFDLSIDLSNCGACGRACPADPANAAATCVAGSCGLVCDPGYADCDEELGTGCEVSLAAPATCGDCTNACDGAAPFCSGQPSTGFSCVATCPSGTSECSGSCVSTTSNPIHCGMCGRACASPPNAIGACVASSCTYTCDTGFHDCDGTSTNGCESQWRELANCGACDSACSLMNASESCNSGTCHIVACDSGFADCDRSASNGCEADLVTSTTHCGGCDAACGPMNPPNADTVCTMGRCGLECAPGYGDCDGDSMNGCEADLSRAAVSCGSCGIRCSAGQMCVEDGSGGYTCSSTTCPLGQTPCGGACCDVARCCAGVCCATVCVMGVCR